MFKVAQKRLSQALAFRVGRVILLIFICKVTSQSYSTQKCKTLYTHRPAFMTWAVYSLHMPMMPDATAAAHCVSALLATKYGCNSLLLNSQGSISATLLWASADTAAFHVVVQGQWHSICASLASCPCSTIFVYVVQALASTHHAAAAKLLFCKNEEGSCWWLGSKAIVGTSGVECLC